LDAEATGSRLSVFYASRLRRVVPALGLVLLFCLGFTFLFAPPQLVLAVGRQMGWAAAFGSDILAWRDSGVRDPLTPSLPLDHLWQLALIVKFYVVWPLAVYAARHRPRLLAWAAGATLAASFALQLFLSSEDAAAALFLPWARWWELMAGALLALWQMFPDGTVSRSKPRADTPRLLQSSASASCAWSGVAMLVLAAALADKAALWPPLWAVLPVLGSVLLLAAGSDGWITRQLISHPVLRFYGLIAYPLLLWHWPLLSFPPLLGVALTIEVRVLILLASVVLAALTYELIDKPLRQIAPGPGLSQALLGVLAVVALLGWVAVYSDGLRFTYPVSMRAG
jgi:peptidoglycan/LPS O-acetylase OafA/YrhL